MKDLRRLYKEYLKYEERSFIKDSIGWLGNNKKITTETKRRIYKNYHRASFFQFLKNLKDIIYSPSPFDFITKGTSDDWGLFQYLSFLKEKGVIKISRNGRITEIKGLKEMIPAPQSEEEIIEKIERKFKINNSASVLDLFGEFTDFKPKGNWDQMPISQGSAIFIVKKILDYLPLYGKFLFIGDDDFISVLLGLAEPKSRSFVIDADKDLLNSINLLTSRFKLGIETKNVDLRKRPLLNGCFTGFLCNPPYTEEGSTSFLSYGLDQLGSDGGSVFLAIGTQDIGNRAIFMQRFFTQRNLIIKEMITERIKYPFLNLHPEDETCFQKMKTLFNQEVITKNPKLGADLLIFNYIPFKIERISKSRSLYRYL